MTFGKKIASFFKNIIYILLPPHGAKGAYAGAGGGR